MGIKREGDKWDGLDEDLRRLGSPDLTDWYRPGKEVSIEQEAETQLELQRRLDKLVELENRGVDDHHGKRGRRPCQRVRKGEA